MTVHWGAMGHASINRVAAQHMGSDMPDFFKGATDRLVEFGGQPDRWKIDGLPHLADANVPDHYISSELVGSNPYPEVRSQFMEMLVHKNIAPPGYVALTVGFLPYRMAEGFETLVADFALWRKEVSEHGPGTALAQELADHAVSTGGLLGHFVGDAAQPLHTTVHNDGWRPQVEPNPDGFTTQKGIHFRFETAYVNENVKVSDFANRLAPPQDLDGDPLKLSLDFIAQNHTDVRTVYELDKEGQIDPAHNSPKTTALIDDHLAAGAQFLTDMWSTAWHRSAAVVGQIQDPRNTPT